MTMVTKKQKAAATSPGEDVSAYMQLLDHPLKNEIEAVRALILDADVSINEAVKWNAPSFYTQEFFATIHVKNTKAVQVILHLGAKAKTAENFVIEDSNGLLEWLGQERASVKFGSLQEIHNHAAAFSSIISQWIKHVPNH